MRHHYFACGSSDSGTWTDLKSQWSQWKSNKLIPDLTVGDLTSVENRIIGLVLEFNQYLPQSVSSCTMLQECCRFSWHTRCWNAPIKFPCLHPFNCKQCLSKCRMFTVHQLISIQLVPGSNFSDKRCGLSVIYHKWHSRCFGLFWNAGNVTNAWKRRGGKLKINVMWYTFFIKFYSIANPSIPKPVYWNAWNVQLAWKGWGSRGGQTAGHASTDRHPPSPRRSVFSAFRPGQVVQFDKTRVVNFTPHIVSTLTKSGSQRSHLGPRDCHTPLNYTLLTWTVSLLNVSKH